MEKTGAATAFEADGEESPPIPPQEGASTLKLSAAAKRTINDCLPARAFRLSLTMTGRFLADNSGAGNSQLRHRNPSAE
jgi:hypothetical protein